MIARLLLPLFSLPWAATAPAAAQDPDQPIATYKLLGEPRTITRTDIALEMATHLRRLERGRQAVDFLVNTTLIRTAAEKQGLIPGEAEVREYWKQLKEQLRNAGHRPEESAAVRNTDERQWLQDLGVQMAQERLVRRELDLPAKEKVSGDMLELWIAEARKRGDVVIDPDRLPFGVAARVGATSVPLIDLGFLLLRTAEDEERDRFVRQFAYLETLDALARRHDLEVTPADLDVAVERRRREAQRDPRFRAVSFESLLEAQGLTIASLRASRTFRAHVLLDKVSALLTPDAALAAELAEQREQVLEQVGPRRRVGVVFLNAMTNPNSIVVRDFDQAERKLLEVRKRIAVDGFAATASIESEDPDSKRRGGDVGWHRRHSNALPKVVRDAAFAMQTGEVSMPLRDEQGCYLVSVLEIEPTPDDAELLLRLRELRTREFGDKTLRECEIELAKADAGQPK